MKINIEPNDENEIIRLYKDGKSPEKISQIFSNYSPYIIRNMLKKRDLCRERHIITDSVLYDMIQDYQKGMNFTMLSKKYGFHSVIIAKRIKEAGQSHSRYYPKITEDQVMSLIKENGLVLIKAFDETSIGGQTIHVCDTDGYKYVTTWTLLRQKHKPLKYSPNNPYSIDNINLMLNQIRNGEYYCPTNQIYTSNTSDLIFIHKPCNTSFISNLASMQGKIINNNYKYYCHCKICYPEKLESTHASVLKQVFMHEYPDTETEEKSCINPKTNRSLPTDIVNHRLKIAIEIQSSYHDDPDKQAIDIFKKQYWIDKGYDFYDPDIRDYSVIEMIQLFFPDIKQIPHYIDYHYSDKIDYHIIQEQLNNGRTIKEVSDELGIAVYTIHNAIARGVVLLPEECKRKAMRAKGLVHLSKDGKFIKEYSHLNDVSDDNYALGTIQRVLKGEQKYAYDSLWIYSDDYHNNNYSVPKIEPDKYLVPIISLYNGNIDYYSNVYDASKQLNCHPCEIYNVLNGKRKTYMGYQFKFNQ